MSDLGKGKKQCPNCVSIIGARTLLCNCGYHFPSVAVRKDLLKAKEEAKTKVKDGAGRGKKHCPNCQIELGARTQLCSCGYYFPEGKVRTDLLEEKALVAPKEYTDLGKGRKQCPICNIIVGGVTKTCHKCSYDFVAAKKEKDIVINKKKEEKAAKRANKSEQKTSAIVQELLTLPAVSDQEAENFTPEDHARRVLSYGKDRASALLLAARKTKSWNHINWDLVEKELVSL